MIAGRWMLLALCVTVGPALAQPKKERMTFSWVMQLRHQLWQECRSASPELLEQVAADLTSDSAGNPLLPLARALARVRGVEPDAAFLYRACVQCIATPEVIDLDRFKQVTLTMHTPYRPPAGTAAGFAWRVEGGPESRALGGRSTPKNGAVDLLRYRTTVDAELSGWPAGAYRASVETEVETGEGGAEQRSTDPVATAEFEVVPGFPQRVLGLQQVVDDIRGRMDAATMLVVNAALARVQRAYIGEPRRGRTPASEDLREAEAIVRNVAEGRPALDGREGWVTIGVPSGEDEAVMVSVRLPASETETPRPLLLFVPGAPAWDHRWSRPTSPKSTSPHWLRDVLQDHGLDPEHRWLVAVMESPGRVRMPENAVAAVVSWLRERFEASAETVLVGEREGAAAVTRALSRDAGLATGIALVCGGSLDAAAASRLSEAHVLASPGRDHPGNVNLERAVRLLGEAGAKVRVTPAKTCPWQIAVPLLLPELEQWLQVVR